MKNKIIVLVLVFATFFQISCSKDEPENDGLPYYQFTENEKNNLINEPNVGDDIIYKNQDNELLKFKVYKSKKGKTTFTTGNFASSYSSQHFHYDRQEISMWYAEGYLFSSCIITIRKYPVGSNYQISPIILGTPEFYGYFEFPLWNGYYGTDIHNNTISIDFNIPPTAMTINGKNYTKVRIFESNRIEVLGSTWSLPLRPKNVNIVYYDDNFGVIGFDDLDGKLWRIQ